MQIPDGGRGRRGKDLGSGFPPSNPSGDSSYKQSHGTKQSINQTTIYKSDYCSQMLSVLSFKVCNCDMHN